MSDEKEWLKRCGVVLSRKDLAVFEQLVDNYLQNYKLEEARCFALRQLSLPVNHA